MVLLNRIYTRTGDDGTTALANGERRPKSDLRIGAYGTVDETNAAIGVARLHLSELPAIDAMMGRVQNDLFDLGADLAVPERQGNAERLRMLETQVTRLEHEIDELNAALQPLNSFVLPGGTVGGGVPAPGPHHLPPGGTCHGGTRRPPRTSRSAPSRSNTSTGSPTCCSSPAALPMATVPGTCSGCPARTANSCGDAGYFLAFAR